MPDRIEAGTFVIGAAVTGGDVTLSGAPSDHMGAFLEIVESVGVSIETTSDTMRVRGAAPAGAAYSACDIRTGPYPELATDLQPPTGVLLSQARGTSLINETIFEDRLEWLEELGRMGASVEILDDHHASVTGPSKLKGTTVEIGDLRAGASLILAALAANGLTTIRGAHHVHRGYENIEGKFLDLGAKIERIREAVSGR
jgi:UDP-N-acetylglucosamine 1-carboxyvinyltransferase